jgi:hypothetical protein
MSDRGSKVLWHQSGVSPTGEPFVQLLLGDEIIAQLSPEQARDHARAITEAAEAAEQDAFLIDFATNQLGTPHEAAGALLVAFREYRQERTGKAQGPRHPKDWVMPPKDKMPNYGEFWKKGKR